MNGPTDRPRSPSSRQEDLLRAAAGLIRTGLEHRRAGRIDLARTAYEDAAEQFRAGGDLVGAATACNNLGALALQTGDLDGAEEAFAEARRTAAGPCAAAAHACGNLGLVERERGRSTEAAAYFREAVELHERIGNRRGAAQARGNLGLLALARGHLDDAEAILLAAEADFRSLQDPLGTAVALNAIGDVRRTRGDLEGARTAFTESLALCEAAGFSEGRRTALQNLGNLARAAGDLDEAEACYRAALAAAALVADPRAAAAAHTNLGHVLSARGDRLAGRAEFEKSRALNESAGFEAGAAGDLANLAASRMEDGDVATALADFQQARARFRDAGHIREAVSVTLSAAQALAVLGRIDEARAHLAEAVQAAESLGLDALVTVVHGTRAALEIGRRPLPESRREMEAVESALASRGDKRGRATALINLADIAAWEGDFARSLALAKEARLFSAVRDLGGIEADATVLLGEIAERTEEFDDALHEYEAARELYRSHRSPQGLARTTSGIARVLALTGRGEEAQAALDEALPIWASFPAPSALADLEVVRGRIAGLAGAWSPAAAHADRAIAEFERLKLPLPRAMAVAFRADCRTAAMDPERASADRAEALRELRSLGAHGEARRLENRWGGAPLA